MSAKTAFVENKSLPTNYTPPKKPTFIAVSITGLFF